MIATQTPRVIKIAILDCELFIPEVADIYGKYFSCMFMPLLQSAALRAQNLAVEVQAWDAANGHLPDPTTIDAVLVTGAVAAAYDPFPWVEVLGDYLRTLYTHHPHIKILGTCFGHQLIGHVLLREFGVVAQPNPYGKQIGIRSVKLDPAISLHFGEKVRGLDELRIQVVHGDHVLLPDYGLPEGWYSVGKTECCLNHGLFQPGRVLTWQGHFEFNSISTRRIVEGYFRQENGYTKEWVEAAVAKIGEGDNDDTEVITDILLAFLAT